MRIRRHLGAVSSELHTALAGVAIAALGALAAAISIVGTYGALYLRKLIETRTEALEVSRTTRLREASDTVVAAVEETARLTGIRGAAKQELAREKIKSLMPSARLTDAAITTAVQAGVTRMRHSLPTGSLRPSATEALTGHKPLPPPSRVPAVINRGSQP